MTVSHRTGIIALICCVLLMVGLIKLQTYLFGEYVGTNVTEEVVDSREVEVKVGESFPIEDVFADEYLYQGVMNQSDDNIQLQIGKRIRHDGSHSESYEVQEMLVDIKSGQKIKAIETKNEDERFYYDITFLELKENAIEVRLDKIEITEEVIKEGGVVNKKSEEQE